MSLDRPMTDAELIAKANARGSLCLKIDCGPDSPLRAKPRQRRQDREYPMQCDVIVWADDPATLPEYPELKTLYAIPNQGGSGKSKRQRQLEGARQKAEGLRRGMPDLCLPCPRLDCSATLGTSMFRGALYLEMKAETGALGLAQRRRIAQLRAAGNKCEVAMSADAAKAIITQYLQLPKQ